MGAKGNGGNGVARTLLRACVITTITCLTILAIVGDTTAPGGGEDVLLAAVAVTWLAMMVTTPKRP